MRNCRESLATDLGARRLVALCDLGLCKLYRRTGDHLKAREHLTTATALQREVDMRFWLEQAQAELKELGSKGTKKARGRR
ncbi:MAG: hypothetical protein ACE5JD_14205 [Candidatus Methylomirabilia bacterium]